MAVFTTWKIWTSASPKSMKESYSAYFGLKLNRRKQCKSGRRLQRDHLLALQCNANYQIHRHWTIPPAPHLWFGIPSVSTLPGNWNGRPPHFKLFTIDKLMPIRNKPLRNFWLAFLHCRTFSTRSRQRMILDSRQPIVRRNCLCLTIPWGFSYRSWAYVVRCWRSTDDVPACILVCGTCYRYRNAPSLSHGRRYVMCRATAPYSSTPIHCN